MRIPEAEYSFESFLEYIKENHDSVYEDEERKKWLKVHTVLHALDDWKSRLFAPSEIRHFGEITEIVIARDKEQQESYYAAEYAEGLLIFFSSAVLESYEATLGDRIRKNRGVTRAWISPGLFQTVWQSILSGHDGYVHRFTSRRGSLDDTPSRIRPNYKRRFSYTGNDGTQVVKELQNEYGVAPESMYLRINPELTIQVTTSGYFAAREITPEALTIILESVEMVKDELLETKETSESLRFEVASMLDEETSPRVAAVTAGRIGLRGRPLSAGTVEEFMRNAEDFSFIDFHLKEGSLGFSAAVVDEVKGSVFDVSMTEKEITMIPKYNTTFESFIDFLRTVREQLDEQATLKVWDLPEG